MKQLRFASLLAAIALFLVGAASAAQSINGTWELQRVGGTPYIEMRLSSTDAHEGENTIHSGDHYKAADFGLTDARVDGATSQTQFGLQRAAGTFAFSGMLGNGRGGGVFTFTPDDTFVAGLNSRGLKPDNNRGLLAAGNVDLTLPYIDSIRSAGYPNLSFDKMLAFRALHVTPQSIADLRAVFGTMREDDVISSTALGVTKSYVDEMHGMGVEHVTPQKAVEFKALHITPEYVAGLAQLGYAKLTPDQIVQFKAMRIDAAYLKHLADHGLKNLTPEQVVQAKATGL